MALFLVLNTMKSQKDKKHKRARPKSRARYARNRPTASSIKIAPPQLATYYPRSQLFREVDRARKRAVVWVSAPAGAGKTVLAASYLDTRRLAHIWYAFDERDSDPAIFFYYLREAVAELNRRRRLRLPLLTPKHLGGAAAFTRNFFDKLYSAVPRPFALVFDNWHELPDGAALHELLAIAFALVPEGVNVFVLSRTAPPPPLAALQVKQKLVVLHEGKLALTRAETLGLVRLQGSGRLPPQTAAALMEKTRGWAAGVVLLLEHMKQRRDGELDTEALPTVVFDYFAAEVFARTDPGLQSFLLHTALLPQMDAPLVQALTGRRDAADVFARLAARNYFTTRIAAGETAYRYHPLFREFLLAQSRRQYRPEELRALQQRAITVLRDRRMYDDAGALILAYGDTAALAEIAEKHAAALIARGQFKTLEVWLREVPEATLSQRPWLLYWFGVCRMPFALPEARSYFERAYSGFAAVRDARGMYFTLSDILESFVYQWDDFGPVPGWIEQLDRLEESYPLSALPDVEPRVIAAAFAALCFACPHHSRVPALTARVDAIVRSAPVSDTMCTLAGHLGLYYAWMGDTTKQREIAALIDLWAQHSDAGVLPRLYGRAIRSVICWLAGEAEQAEREALQALAEGERSGVHALDTFVLAQACYARSVRGDVIGFADYLERLRTTLLPDRRLDIGHYHHICAWLAMERHDYARALDHADTALRSAVELSCHFPIALNWLVKADVLCTLGEHGHAEALLQKALDFARTMGSDIIRCMGGLRQAWLARCRGDEQGCLAHLRETFRLGRLRGYVVYPHTPREAMTQLCAIALKHGIEVDYVRAMIKKRNLLSPVDEPIAAWPFPVKIHTLGRFAVLLDDQPLTFTTKAQKKPLELLKALIALGGERVREDTLTELLWPDAEADAAARALTSALHRLRKLIGDKAIERQEGHLTLNRHRCWVDLWALEQVLTDLAHACREKPDETATPLIERVLDIYRGAFLETEPDTPWALSARERLRAKLLRHLDAAARGLIAGDRPERAIACYERGLEIDPLTEPFYRGLMQSYLALDRRAEAISTYERCCRRLKDELGIAPSAETEALARRVKAG